MNRRMKLLSLLLNIHASTSHTHTQTHTEFSLLSIFISQPTLLKWPYFGVALLSPSLSAFQPGTLNIERKPRNISSGLLAGALGTCGDLLLEEFSPVPPAPTSPVFPTGLLAPTPPVYFMKLGNEV